MKLCLSIFLLVLCQLSFGQTITETDTIYHRAIIKQGKKNKVFLDRNTTIQVIGKDEFVYDGYFEGISRTVLYIREELNFQSNSFTVDITNISSVQSISSDAKKKGEYLLFPIGAGFTAVGIGHISTAIYYKSKGLPLLPSYWTIGGIVALGIGVPMMIVGLTNPPKDKNKVQNENWVIEYY